VVLDRLTELGLRPVHRDSWENPEPHMSVQFGTGSGWLWGDLVIRASGRLCDFRVHWFDRDGNEQLTRLDAPTAIRRELERHAARRQERIAELAERHGLSVAPPAGADSEQTSNTRADAPMPGADSPEQLITLDLTDLPRAVASLGRLDNRAHTLLRQGMHAQRITTIKAGILDIVRATLARERPDEPAPIGVLFAASDYDEGLYISHLGAHAAHEDGYLEYLNLSFPELHDLFDAIGVVAPDATLIVNLQHDEVRLTRKVSPEMVAELLAAHGDDYANIDPWERPL
jgi:hypothetical protein